jgi:hypothetical protein
MNLKEAAEIYVELIKLEEKADPSDQAIREELSVLRSKYHEIFMDLLRKANIEFSDRFEATDIAFKLAA